jgi:predicted enzyme related to lactoylglutathione lyase
MGANLQAVHPVLAAAEVEEMVRFYQCLGFAVVFQDAPINPKYVAMKRDDVELHIQWADKEQWAYPTDRPAYRFVVTDVDEMYQEFVKSGGIRADTGQGSPWASPKDTPWGTREFHLRDPSQNSLQFYRPL